MAKYNCPELIPTYTDGKLDLFTLGQDENTYIVFGTKSARQALKFVRKYERDECGLHYSEGMAADHKDDIDSLALCLVAWRNITKNDEGTDLEGYANHFSWLDKDTIGNPCAKPAFKFEGSW